MATLALGAMGIATSGSIGAAMLGIGAGLVDTMVGNMLMPAQKSVGQRLDPSDMRVTGASEGMALPRVFGRMRLAGNVIWATDFDEQVKTTHSGGKMKPRVESTNYSYSASFAIALCAGEIGGIGRVWADGTEIDLTDITWRWYPGSETQDADSLIASLSPDTPTYRGTAYVVFEDLPLEPYGRRLPQLTFEVFRPLPDDDVAEGLIPAVTLIPGTGEFAYATTAITRRGATEAATITENSHAQSGRTDIVMALDQLQAQLPQVTTVSLVVAWFGTDLRCGECRIVPGVEQADKSTSVTWSVGSYTRGTAHLVSRATDGTSPVYGGTPSDASIIEAIAEIKARGLKVTFYPFILMDIPPGNTLPNPYSDNAAEAGQSALPWRGRITCTPAPDVAGTVDGTSAVADQAGAFFGHLTPFVTHYATLCAAAGGVDSFLIGSEMVALNRVRDDAGAFPAVTAWKTLAASVKGIVGAGCEVGYAADWSEWNGYQRADGSFYFHLDPLWSDANVAFIGVDNYTPLSDWRDGFGHLDAQMSDGWRGPDDVDYLRAGIEAGEDFDWYYASDADRDAQVRTPITDGAAGKPWVFRAKDFRNWWSNSHHDRPGGVESATATDWTPKSKPIRFTEMGCPAIDRGPNQPNVFVDPKSSESSAPYFSRATRNDAVQRAWLEAVYGYWTDNNETAGGVSLIDIRNCAAWTWDARPYPFFPGLVDFWADGGNWHLGHWLTGRVGGISLRALVRALCAEAGLGPDLIALENLPGGIEGYVIANVEDVRTSIRPLARQFAFDAVETGGKIAFRARNRPGTDTIVLDRDAVTTGQSGDAFELVRKQETELPRVMRWTVARADEDYDSALIEAPERETGSKVVTVETFPFAASPEMVFGRVWRALRETWTERESLTLSLPPSRLALDPGDVIGVTHDGRTLDYRVVEARDGTSRAMQLLRSDRDVYDTPAGAPWSVSLQAPAIYGPALAVLLDLPQWQDGVAPQSLYLAVTASPWPGTQALWQSIDGGDHTLAVLASSRAAIGSLAADLPAGPVNVWDIGSELVIDLPRDTLAPVTDDQAMAGANLFAVETPSGWEIVAAVNVELASAGRYRLTRLLRGQRGTEWAMGAVSGARVVQLSDALVPVAIAAADIGRAFAWKIGPASAPIDDPALVALTTQPGGAGLGPFSPCHLAAPILPRTAGDIALNWIRRDRALPANAWTAAATIPLSDVPEAYEVDILHGATVLRTLEVATPSATYTAAQQVVDWGAALSPGATLDVRIYQMSPVIGRGAGLGVTLDL